MATSRLSEYAPAIQPGLHITNNRDRRAQQLLRNTLGMGYAQYCAPNKEALRKRIAFLRALGKHSQLQRAKRRLARSAPNPANALDLSIDRMISNQSNLPSAMKNSPRTRNLEHNILQADISLESKQSSKQQSSDRLITDDSRSAITTRSASIRSILKRASYSSSLISDIESVLNLRFSISTFSNSSRPSFSVSSVMINGGEPRTYQPDLRTGPSPSAILEIHQSKMRQANAALISFCCSNDPSCVHCHIKDAAIAISQGSQAEELHPGSEKRTCP
jgi:hypothetical protein